ncbi:MAG: M56 family metallopeptidase, partial [Ferruginibacter sp.]
ELAHIKRNDYLVNLLQTVTELVLFFNPFAILLSNAAKKERENCCDDWVMNFQYGQYDYAKALLILEEHRHITKFQLVLAATNNKKNLLKRIKRLFNILPQTNCSASQKLKLTSLAFLLVITMIAFFPALNIKPSNLKIDVLKKSIKPLFAKFENPYREHSATLAYKNLPVRRINARMIGKKVSKSKKQVERQPERDYVNALINEELLYTPPQVEPIVSQIAERQTNNSKFIVVIEDQQSGKRPTNTYYFELNSKDGNPAIKPLLMLNKFKVSLKNVPRTLNSNLDSLHTPVNKKKITS